MSGTMDQPLAGVRILECSTGIAGAVAGSLLQLQGASVALATQEGRHPLDGRAPFTDGGTSLTSAYFHAGKERFDLDHADLGGASVRFDGAIIETDPGTVLALAGQIECPAVLVTPFGLDGPRRDWRTSELVAQAYAGLVFMTGSPERPPIRVGVPIAEYATGQAAAAGLLLAMLNGDGDYRQCEVSIVESALSIMEHSFATWSLMGHEWQRQGNHGRAAWGIYPCLDGYVGVISGLGTAWQRFRELIGGELLEERFGDTSARSVHADELHARVIAWLADKTQDEAFALAQAADLPFSILCDTGAVLGLDQLKHRGYFEPVEIDGHDLVMPGRPGRVRVATGAVIE